MKTMKTMKRLLIVVVLLAAILLAIVPMGVAGEGVVPADVAECIPQPPMGVVWGRADGLPLGTVVEAYVIRSGKDRINPPVKVSEGGVVFNWGQTWQGEDFSQVYTLDLMAAWCGKPGMRPSAVNVMEIRANGALYGYVTWTGLAGLFRLDLIQPVLSMRVVPKRFVLPPVSK